MTTYAAIKYAIPGTAITGVLKTASNLNDVASLTTSRDNLGVEIGVTYKDFSASAGTNANGARTVSTSSPSGGSDGDVWYKYS